ncbi:MAG: rRNA (uracil1498-N3)-methyltransferase [Frankiales bacterium]|nr:rRNA (uracil1498-N3)-methyltransferase [Frankiales bacterium]
MSAPVFYGDISGSVPRLTGDEAHHAAVVRRITVGERIVISDGLGNAVCGPVAAVSRDQVTIAPESTVVEPSPVPRLVVVQALAKGDRGELAVELLTEVGVDVILPWAASRCVVQLRGERGDKAIARWRATARAAAKQARRLRVPEVADVIATRDVTELLATAALPVVLHESARVPLADLVVPDAGEVVVVVGPEGGITDEELAAFGVPAVRLGPTVMRTSTAGAAACAALLARTPRWA